MHDVKYCESTQHLSYIENTALVLVFDNPPVDEFSCFARVVTVEDYWSYLMRNLQMDAGSVCGKPG